MFLVKPPLIVKTLFGKEVVWDIKTKEKELFLTFDDGPTSELTPFILQTLDEYQAKATFFCVGENVKNKSELFNDILESGHMVGNHTYCHLNGLETENSEYFLDVQKCQELYPFKLFRPPYGKLKLSQLAEIKKMNLKVVFWSVLPYDFHEKMSKEKCLDNVMKYTRNGSVIVLHDNIKARENLKYVLPKILEYFTGKGYSFKSIPTE